jgi:DMSO/TMAO reductase YedYZ molybdopterin-dependent catalytic subunit
MSHSSDLDTSLDRRAVLRTLPLLPFGVSTFLTSTAAAGRASEIVPFLEKTRLQAGVLTGQGLEGRLAYDLSRLATEETSLVANSDFYIRTRAPEKLPSLEEWTVSFSIGQDASGHFRDFGGLDTAVPVSDLQQRAEPMGRHLLECSGNSARVGFGLLSVAEWHGVPLATLFEETLSNLHSSTLIRVRGRDDHQHDGKVLAAGERHGSSVAGASWIFSLHQLKDTGAFLAVGMNGEALSPDHGAPVRLIVPGWYGCANIKWVESVDVMSRDEPPSHQMREFASRTHQDGQPELARDYQPATLDFAAMPVVVEGPAPDGSYHATGIAWGNPAGADRLEIRWQRTAESPAPWQEVPGFEKQAASDWTVWRHRFTPTAPGVHEITLRLGDRSVRTRRLDSGYYARSVTL